MSGKVKVKVAEEHNRTYINVDGKKATKDQPVKVDEDNVTVKNCLEAGSLEVVDNFHETDEDEVEGTDDRDGEADTQDVEEAGEEETDEQDAETEEEDFQDMTVSELREKCEEYDVKKSGTKDELVERLKNLE